MVHLQVAELLGLPPGIPKQGSKEQAVFTLLFQKIATANGSDNDKEITWNEFEVQIQVAPLQN